MFDIIVYNLETSRESTKALDFCLYDLWFCFACLCFPTCTVLHDV